MKIKKILAAGSVALASLSIGGFAVGSAHASTPTNAPVEVQQAVDTDNVQEQVGDQTGPDGANEAPEAEAASGTETPGESDGPGGHADPAGNVDHQFEGEE